MTNITNVAIRKVTKDGTKKYKQLIKFNKKLHAEIQAEILKKYNADVVPGDHDDTDNPPY